MRTRVTTLCGLIALAGAAASASAQVAITEIFNDLNGPERPGEFVELTNFDTVAVDITGWFMDDEDGGQGAPIPGPFIIQPGESVVLYNQGDNINEADPMLPVVPEYDDDDFFANWGMTNADGNTYRVIGFLDDDFISFANSPSISNEIPVLRDDLGNQVDEANYRSGEDGWPAIVAGATIYLEGTFGGPFAQSDNDEGAAWRVSELGLDGAVASVGVFVDDGMGGQITIQAADNVASPGFFPPASTLDCNNNGTPDPLDIIPFGIFEDLDADGVPDDIAGGCEADCDMNGVIDDFQIIQDSGLDCNVDGILDSCQTGVPGIDDNGNGTPDSCEAIVGAAIITEIMFNPLTSPELEYVEIFNTTGAPLDISGWFLEDIEVGGNPATNGVPAGTILPPGGVAVLADTNSVTEAETLAAFQAVWGTMTPAGVPILFIPTDNWGARANTATSTREILALKAADGVIVDIVNYETTDSNGRSFGNGWPGQDGVSSISLNADSLDAVSNDNGANWSLSIEGLNGSRRCNTIEDETVPGVGRAREDYGSPGFVPSTFETPSGEVIITEIAYTTTAVFPGQDPADPESDGGLDEYIEIYNTTNATIDISGWWVQDEDGRTGAIAPGSSLAPGEVAIIIGNDFPFDAPNIVVDFCDAWGLGDVQIFTVTNWYEGGADNFGMGRLSNGPGFNNEIIRIVDNTGTPVDIVNFDDTGDGVFPELDWIPDGDGLPSSVNFSIYLLDFAYNSVDNDAGDSWAASNIGTDQGRAAAPSMGNVTFNFDVGGGLLGSPGSLEGVATPDLGATCPDPVTPACALADITTDGSCTPGVFDGAVTLSDFSCFLSEWSAGSPIADITITGECTPGAGGDGVDLSDFSCYLAEWSGGCDGDPGTPL
ncbi:MAG: lamin tail domain-containing protein [Planctomycetota bacterium]